MVEKKFTHKTITVDKEVKKKLQEPSLLTRVNQRLRPKRIFTRRLLRLLWLIVMILVGISIVIYPLLISFTLY